MEPKKAPRPPRRVTRSNAEAAALAAEVADLLARMTPKYLVKRHIRERLGPVSAATCERYMSRARASRPDLPPPKSRVPRELRAATRERAAG